MSDIKSLWDEAMQEDEDTNGSSDIKSLWDEALADKEAEELYPEASWLEMLPQAAITKPLAHINNMAGGGIQAVEELLGTGTEFGKRTRERGTGILEELEQYQNLGKNPLKKFTSEAISGVVSMAPMLAAPTTIAGIVPLALGASGEKYASEREKGQSVPEAALSGGLMGAFEGASEVIPMTRFLKHIPNSTSTKELLKNVAKGSTENAIQEGAVSGAEQALDLAMRGDRGGDFGDILYDTALGGVVGTGLGGVASLKERTANIKAANLEAEALQEAEQRIKTEEFESKSKEEDPTNVDLPSFDESLNNLKNTYAQEKAKIENLEKIKFADKVSLGTAKEDLSNLEKEISRQEEIRNSIVTKQKREEVKETKSQDLSSSEFPSVKKGLEKEAILLVANKETSKQKEEKREAELSLATARTPALEEALKTKKSDKQLRIEALLQQQQEQREVVKTKKAQKNIEKIVSNLNILSGRKAPEDVKIKSKMALDNVIQLETNKDFKLEEAISSLPQVYKSQLEEQKNLIAKGEKQRKTVFSVASIQKAILDESIAKSEKLAETQREREIRNASRQYEQARQKIDADINALKSLKQNQKGGEKYFQNIDINKRIKQLSSEILQGKKVALAFLKKAEGRPLTKNDNEIINMTPPVVSVDDVEYGDSNREFLGENYDDIIFEISPGNTSELSSELRYIPKSAKAKVFVELSGKSSLNQRELELLKDTGYEIGVNINTDLGNYLFGDSGKPRGVADIRFNIIEPSTENNLESPNAGEEVSEEFLDSLEYLNAPILEMDESGTVTSRSFFDLLNSEKGALGKNIGDSTTLFTYLSDKFLNAFLQADPQAKKLKNKYNHNDVNSEKLRDSDAYYSGYVKTKNGYTEIPGLSKALSELRRRLSLSNGVAKKFSEYAPVFMAMRQTLVILPSRNIHRAQEKLNPFIKLKDTSRVTKELITARIMATKGFNAKESPEYLAEKGLSPVEIEAYLSVREYMQGEALDQIQAGLLADPPKYLFNQETGEPHNIEDLEKYYKKVNTFTETMRSQKYVPFNRYGKYYVYSKKANSGAGHFSFHDDRVSQMEAISKLKESGVQGNDIDEGTVATPSKEAKIKGFDGMPLEFLAFLADTGDVEAAEILKQSLPKIKSLPSNQVEGQDGFFKNLMTAQLTPGYSLDLKRAVSQYATKLATWNGRKVGKALFKTAISGLEEGSYLKERAKNDMDYILNQTDAAPGLRALFAVWYLSRPLSAAVNLTQQLTFTLPLLSLHTNNSLTEASKTWLSAQKDSMAYLTTGQKGMSERDPALLQYLNDLSESGQLSDINTSELSQIGRAVKGTPTGYYENITRGMMAAFSGVEVLNRTHAAVAYYKATRKNNPYATPSELLSGGMQFILDTQGDGSRANKPQVFRGKGAFLGIFRSYSFLFFSTLKQQMGAKNFKVISAIAGMHFALGGALALPGAAIVLRIMKMLGESPEEDLKLYLAELSKADGFEHDFYGDTFSHGLLGAIDSPLTLASSLSMGEMLPEGNSTSSSVDIAIQATLGVLASPLQNKDRAVKYWDKNLKAQAIEAVVPTGVKGIMRGVRSFYEDGLLDSQGDNLLPNITPFERTVLFLGGTTKRQSNKSDIAQYTYEEINAAKKKSNIEFRLAQITKTGQGESSPEFLELLEQAHKEGTEINWTTYKRHLKNREERDMMLVPKKSRGKIHHLRETLTFPSNN